MKIREWLTNTYNESPYSGMSGDLISRSALLQTLKYNKTINEDEAGAKTIVIDINEMIKYVEKMPTAYDVDKVVEEWKDIIGYEGIYQISNLGNVRSLDRVVHPINKYIQKGSALKPINNGKYAFVTLRKDGRKEIKYIHRLVAEYFVPNPLMLNEVNHIDENRYNNNSNNLEWCTHSYNTSYGTRNERISNSLKAGGVE